MSPDKEIACGLRLPQKQENLRCYLTEMQDVDEVRQVDFLTCQPVVTAYIPHLSGKHRDMLFRQRKKKETLGMLFTMYV